MTYANENSNNSLTVHCVPFFTSKSFTQGNPELKGVWAITNATERGRPSYITISETGSQFLLVVLDASGIGWEALLGYRQGNIANTCTVVSLVSACFSVDIISEIKINASGESCAPAEDCMWKKGESFDANRIF